MKNIKSSEHRENVAEKDLVKSIFIKKPLCEKL